MKRDAQVARLYRLGLAVIDEAGVDFGELAGVLKYADTFAGMVVVGVAFDGGDGVAIDFGDDAGVATAVAVVDDEDGAGLDGGAPPCPSPQWGGIRHW